MTLTGVLLPIVLALPAARAPALGLLVAMAWSRMATAHHYPSDVIAGVVIGAALAFPLTRWVMALC
jgi:undecaprenyl-diphosphatase